MTSSAMATQSEPGAASTPADETTSRPMQYHVSRVVTEDHPDRLTPKRDGAGSAPVTPSACTGDCCTSLRRLSLMASDRNGIDIRLQFKPRARLLQLLGDELIGSPRLAVFQFVKNAYDADATRVSVILADTDRSNVEIRIEDDGDGMTLATIRDIWLVPGHDHRARQRQALKRTRLGRLPLGEKGLGRFAAHKLGNRIELVTRATGHDECVVSIDASETDSRRRRSGDARSAFGDHNPPTLLPRSPYLIHSSSQQVSSRL